MNHRVALSLILVAVAGIASAKGGQDCHGCEYPWHPDPPCTNICLTQAVNLATPEELSKKFHLDNKTVQAIEKARQTKPLGSLDDLKGSLTYQQMKNLKHNLNSRDVIPIIERQKTVLENSDKEALTTHYGLDQTTADAIVKAREEKNGSVTLQDLNSKLSDRQKLEVMDAVRSAKVSSGPSK
jgi:DNA uptake protein ComE-like DNA-binding protein